MAVTIKPQDLLTKPLVEQSLTSQNLSFTPHSSLSTHISKTQDLVTEILKAMGLQGSTIKEMMNDFQDKINSIISLTSVLNNESYLNNMVNTYKSQMPEWKDIDLIQEELLNLANKEYTAYFEKEFTEYFTKKDVSNFLQNLIREIAGKEGLQTTTKATINGVQLQFNRFNILKDIGVNESFEKILHDYLLHVFSKDLKIAQKLNKFVEAANNKTLYQEKVLNPNSIEYRFWADTTQAQRHSDISKQYAKDPDFKHEIDSKNLKFKDFLYKSIISNSTGTYNKEILNLFTKSYNSAMSKIFASDPLILYIGRNTNNITGLLGEIEAGIVLELFNGRVSPQAVGALRNSYGKQLGADWWIKYGDSLIAGVQVKNSRESNFDIGFQKLSLEDIKASLKEEYGQYLEAIENLYFIRHFNYQFNRDSSGKLVRMANEKFAPTDNLINQKMAQINAALSSMAADWLHIQTNKYYDKANAQLGRNALYVVNGLWYTATDMLLKIQDQIQTTGTSTAFHINMEEETYQGTQGTILDWIIHNGRGSSYTGDINNPTDFTAQFLKVKYTSAFNFKL